MAFMTFYEYMLEAVESNEKTVAKLEKTLTSIRSHAKRGGESRHRRGTELLERYDDLKARLINTKEGTQQWLAFCQKHEVDVHHNGGDHYS